MRVIPVINCPDIACAKETIARARGFLPDGTMLHLDATDGVFSAHVTWHEPFEWRKLASGFALEVHLMVERPEEYAEGWFVAGARRLIVHVETITPAALHQLLAIARHHGGSIMLSAMPETDLGALEPFIGAVDAFQILAVHPGAAGQRFIPDSLRKITLLRQLAPDATIEVDGGITFETAKAAKAAGADTVVSASYIFNSSDPKKAFEDLTKL